MNRRAILLLSLSSCGHDLSELQAEPGSWLPRAAGDKCIACASTTCLEEERTCAASEICAENYQQCWPPVPTCGVPSLENRKFARCMTSNCYDACNFVDQELDCVGKYSWLQPEWMKDTEFQVDMAAYAGSNLLPTDIAICAGSELSCGPSVHAEQPDLYTMRYRFAYSSMLTPFAHITGPGVQEMLLFESQPFVDNYLLTVAVVPEPFYQGLLASVGQSKNAQQGTIAALMVGCTSSRLAGISFKLLRNGLDVPEAERGVPYYLIGDRPVAVPAATTTQEPNKLGGFANIAPGVYSVVAEKDGVLVGRADSLLVNGGMLTLVNIMPLTM